MRMHVICISVSPALQAKELVAQEPVSIRPHALVHLFLQMRAVASHVRRLPSKRSRADVGLCIVNDLLRLCLRVCRTLNSGNPMAPHRGKAAESAHAEVFSTAL
jgi:hypothetical protein